MFTESTVLVLGAGASKPYKYPTGDDLIDIIVERIKRSIRQTNNNDLNYEDNSKKIIINGEPVHIDTLAKFKAELIAVNPANIDTFLNLYPRYATLGKYLIAEALLEKEQDHNTPIEWGKDAAKESNKENWYRWIINALVSNILEGEEEKLLDNANTLTIVTFNYDKSLEYHLHNRLTRIERFQKDYIEKDSAKVDDKPVSIAKEFLRRLKIYHVYGELYKFDWENGYDAAKYGQHTYGDFNKDRANISEIVNRCYDKIHVIGENKVISLYDTREMKTARAKIKAAKRLFVLGFGFEANNCKLIGLNDGLRGNKGLDAELIYGNFGGSSRIRDYVTKHFKGADRLDRTYSELREKVQVKEIPEGRSIHDGLFLDADLAS
jgi:hypothetical protein